MHQYWLKGFKTEEERKRFKEYVANSTGVLDKVRDFCKEKYNSIDNPSNVDYNNQSWAYSMADSIGYKRALKEILELVTLKPDKE